jgi:thiol-disulfide isomerase/thioredoxin
MFRPSIALAASAAVLSCAACATGSRDSDEDLLSDAFEESIGTDPEKSDTDGDGFDDAREHLAYFDALDDEDMPYEGAWPRLPLPADLEGEGYQEDDVSEDWSADDQFDEELGLHRFFGNVIVLDISAEWCQPCRAAAPLVSEKYEDMRSQGLMVFNMLIEGLPQGEPPDAERWIEDLELSHAVIADNQGEISMEYIDVDGGGFSIPNFTVIGRDMKIVRRYAVGEVDWDEVEDLLEEDPPQVDWALPEDADALREQLEITMLAVDYVVPGQIEGAAGGSGEGGAGDESAATGGNTYGFAPGDENGDYTGPPFGGASCSSSLAGSRGAAASGLAALLGGFLPLAFAAARRWVR